MESTKAYDIYIEWHFPYLSIISKILGLSYILMLFAAKFSITSYAKSL